MIYRIDEAQEELESAINHAAELAIQQALLTAELTVTAVRIAEARTELDDAIEENDKENM